ncbi:MAG: ABC transporter substrate-binding protein [Oscillospiraceae bacterium]|nr:ABC transporter substrate-binding protein [Oscillospiraceae bacterium]
MKLIINENININETEIVINCAAMDARLQHLVDYLRQYSYSLTGTIGEAQYFVSVENILYIDSVDKSTFFYDKHRVYQHKSSLTELAAQLENAMFVRISKNCAINLSHLHSLRSYENHKMEATMNNGERILVGRAFTGVLKDKLTQYNTSPMFKAAQCHSVPCGQVFERSVVNMGKILSFHTVPNRIVALSYSEAEILTALGLTDRIIVIAPAENSSADVSEKHQDSISKIPTVKRQNLGVPAASTLPPFSPDFVLGSFHSLGALGMANFDEYPLLGFPLYMLESTNPPQATLESFYHDIMNLGRIFRVEDKALALVEFSRRRIDLLRQQLTKITPRRIFVYDNGDKIPYTTGKGTFENDLICLSGGQNIFGGCPNGYMDTSWEQVIDADPEFIIVHEYQDGITGKEKVAYLKGRDDLQNVAAVRENKFIIASLLEVFPNTQSASTIEKFIRQFHTGLLP